MFHQNLKTQNIGAVQELIENVKNKSIFRLRKTVSPHQLTPFELKVAINTLFDENSELRKILLTLDLGIPEQSPINKLGLRGVIKILRVAYRNADPGSEEEKKTIQTIKFLERYA